MSQGNCLSLVCHLILYASNRNVQFLLNVGSNLHFVGGLEGEGGVLFASRHLASISGIAPSCCEFKVK